MELLPSVFGFSLVAISWFFARRFFKQMRDAGGRQRDLPAEKDRRRQSQRQIAEARLQTLEKSKIR